MVRPEGRSSYPVLLGWLISTPLLILSRSALQLLGQMEKEEQSQGEHM